MNQFEEKFALSIIVPVYNVKDFLTQCLESILIQTFKDWEMILVDDGSTDGSGDICDKYATSDGRITVIHQVNQGLSAARNTGIKNAKAKYLYFIDSDDELGTPTTLEDNMKIVRQNPDADFVQFPILWYYDENKSFYDANVEGVFKGEDELRRNFQNNIISTPAWNKIFKSEVFRIAMFPVGRYFEDSWFMSDIILKLNKVICTTNGFYKYKIRSGSITQSEFSLEKSKQYIEVKVKRICEVFDQSEFSYLESYLNLFRELLSYSSKFGTKPFENSISILNKNKPKVKSIFDHRKRLHNKDYYELLFLRLMGLRILLRAGKALKGLK